MELPVVKRLKRDLDGLYHELNVRIPKDLQEAAAHGDLSENAEYEAARARQDFVRARIAQLEERVRQLSLYNLSSIPQAVVAYGSRVKLEDVEAGEVIEYQIVFPEEVDPAVGCISLHSPSAKRCSTKRRATKSKSSPLKGNATIRLSAS